MYQQNPNPTGSLFLSALLGGLKWKAHWAGLTALALAIGVAIVGYSMPLGQALNSAAGLVGRECDLFRKVFGWSLLLLLAMCVIAYLQSTPVLGWMVP
ncbi:hypothetical protein SK803_26955 [Lentzea sp. BCCO 10_0856]|uniref:ATP-binding cassette, subfamily B n=1 Tax=Lentzea miocenica TaxID=3095431 RepID=A0ABU4T6U7_9PSEU|nr:hypothetical protein [Lentzea sp. BCCO 10_0856]MDX8033877.1 hypothetical protein [Lentzea sp. BCCO 10_0856]